MAEKDEKLQSLDELAAEADAMADQDGTEEGQAPAGAPDPDAEAGFDFTQAGSESGSEVQALRAELEEMKDRFVRTLAEAENTRKRAERDRREAETYGGSKLARDLLPVYDNMQRALGAIAEEQREANKSLVEGIELTMRELVNVFSRHGMTKITPEVGARFDPQQHEAMFEAPVPNTKQGDIIQVMADGFMLHDRLLRPAQVGVSSTPAS